MPSAAQYKPTGAQLEVFQYTLNLINKDRADFGMPPLTLGFNAAAQKHAQDMFDNYYSSHWGTDGQKPYMRYTAEGGLQYEAENSAYSGWYNSADNPANYNTIDVKQEISILEHSMMYDDAAANRGHKDAILNKWAKQVSLGIVYDTKRVALVQQFEGQYIDYYSPPALSGNTLSMSGQINLSGATINYISVTYDPPPGPLTNVQLTTDPAYTDGYGLGKRVAVIVSPPPAGQSYTNLPPEAVVAGKWVTDASGRFSIQADLSRALGNGKGVYTVVLVATVSGANVNLTNYALVVR